MQRGLNSINISRMLMVETGRYNPIYSRPYETNITGNVINTITDRINQTANHKVSPNVMSGLSAELAAPSAIPQGEIGIHHGWQERRIRFMLELPYTLSTGTSGIYYVQGYTSYTGVSATGAVDPNMEFVINSISSVTRLTTFNPVNGYGCFDRIDDSAQVYTGVDGTIGYNQNMSYGLRPQDIFNGIHTSFVMGDQNDGIDFRSNMGSRPNHNRRMNNLPSSYVSNILDSYLMASELIEYGQGFDDILSNAAQKSTEASFTQNFFMQTLSQNKGYLTNRFTWNDLLAIDPGLESKTTFITLGEAMKVQHNAFGTHDVGMTAAWTGSDRVTQMASLLSSAVPALMMEHLLQKIHIRSTNHDLMGQINTVIIDFKSISGGDSRRRVELFKHRLENELIRDISYNGQDSYMVDISCDLFGETWIGLSLGTEPMIQFAVPSFCDSLYTPVVTHNRDHFFQITHDFNQLISTVRDEVKPSGLNIDTSV